MVRSPLQAGVASVEGDGERALRLYAQAEALFSEHHLGLAAAAAIYARGRILGGDAGSAACDRACSQVASQGIARQALWAHAPGSWEP